jgi:hypothetical protein
MKTLLTTYDGEETSLIAHFIEGAEAVLSQITNEDLCITTEFQVGKCNIFLSSNKSNFDSDR